MQKKSLINFILTMLKIGLFTFGGGYAMIALLQNEFVEKKKWITKEEFLDMVAIAESTPGPIAINSATYLGYKFFKFFGSLFGTIAVCIPSFTIIYIISLFFDKFIELEYVGYAFKGIQICVTFIILNAGIKLFKQMTKNAFNIFVFSVVFILIILFNILNIGFSTVFYILLSGLFGLFIYLISLIRTKNKDKEDSEDAS